MRARAGGYERGQKCGIRAYQPLSPTFTLTHTHACTQHHRRRQVAQGERGRPDRRPHRAHQQVCDDRVVWKCGQGEGPTPTLCRYRVRPDRCHVCTRSLINPGQGRDDPLVLSSSSSGRGTRSLLRLSATLPLSPTPPHTCTRCTTCMYFRQADVYTTSSCSGRISVFAEPNQVSQPPPLFQRVVAATAPPIRCRLYKPQTTSPGRDSLDKGCCMLCETVNAYLSVI